MIIEELRLDNPEHLQQILSLQQKAYRVEAELIGCSDLPPLKDTKLSLQTCGETFYGVIDQDKLVGFISYKYKDSIVGIHRLAVNPDYFRQGIASRLLQFVLAFPEVYGWVVQTGKANTPAVRCYLKHGFCLQSEETTHEGIEIARFIKILRLTSEKEDC